MKKFWLGFGSGIVATMLLCAISPWVWSVARPRTEADEAFRKPPAAISMLRGVFGNHGEFGTIDDISSQTIMLTTRAGSQKTIHVMGDTVIYRGAAQIGLGDLTKGQHIVIIMSIQADGTLKAKLIRVASGSMLIHFAPLTTG